MTVTGGLARLFLADITTTKAAPVCAVFAGRGVRLPTLIAAVSTKLGHI
jgi:hypothetical protein